MFARGEDLSELPGIGKDLAGKIGEIVRSGKLPALEESSARARRRTYASSCAFPDLDRNGCASCETTLASNP